MLINQWCLCHLDKIKAHELSLRCVLLENLQEEQVFLVISVKLLWSECAGHVFWKQLNLRNWDTLNDIISFPWSCKELSSQGDLAQLGRGTHCYKSKIKKRFSQL